MLEIEVEPVELALPEFAIFAEPVARRLECFGLEPRVAMLSFSNFGDAPHPQSKKVQDAAAMVQRLRPDLMIDGEMQANVALDVPLVSGSQTLSIEGSVEGLGGDVIVGHAQAALIPADFMLGVAPEKTLVGTGELPRLDS